jgi:hypothetical protein
MGPDESDLIATALLDGTLNGERFRAYVVRTPAPALKQDYIVVLNNLPAHNVGGARKAIEAEGASLLYLPRYSRDLNRDCLRQAQCHASYDCKAHRYRALGCHPNAFSVFKPDECRNYITAAGYDAYDPI